MLAKKHASITLPISNAAPEHVRDLLTSRDWISDIGTLAIEIVKTQLSTYEARQEVRKPEAVVPSLFDTSTLSLVQSIGDDADEIMKALDELPLDVRVRAMWKIRNIPYALFCELARGPSQIDSIEGDLDEWVLGNETWLRDISDVKILRSNESGEQSMQKPWSHGLVQFFTHATTVFPSSELTDTCRIIKRPSNLPGFKVLDALRSPAIRIQPSLEMFSKTFETMTQSLLKGLQWDNVFVAGGIALGTLLCADDPRATSQPEQWENSDVDLYIYGLGPVEANEKIEHVFSVFKSNLPEGTPVLVVRNSKTITFFSKYPLRRIQVVLKLVPSPREVLLNFDLDICAVGWDGRDVWMLPRAARALETGYTVFTMDLINGHYLGDRRATQEQRVFKYADKGYGIRILPSYLDALQFIQSEENARRGTSEGTQSQELDVEKISQNARTWTLRAINIFKKTSHPISERREPLPQMSHSWLEHKGQKTEDPPGGTCLSGLMLFMRHVALWEYEAAGEIFIANDVWAAPMYDNVYASLNNVSYNDSPGYLWDEYFAVEHFTPQIKLFNESEMEQLNSNLDTLLPERRLPTDFPTQRMSHANSIHEILQGDCDIYLPVWLPIQFVEFAENAITSALRAEGVTEDIPSVFFRVYKDEVASPRLDPGLCLVIWRIWKITMWQQLSRVIDEINEVIWSFHRAYSDLKLSKTNRTKALLVQFAKRAIRKTAQNEYAAFARWVAKMPESPSYYCGELWIIDNNSTTISSESVVQ